LPSQHDSSNISARCSRAHGCSRVPWHAFTSLRRRVAPPVPPRFLPLHERLVWCWAEQPWRSSPGAAFLSHGVKMPPRLARHRSVRGGEGGSASRPRSRRERLCCGVHGWTGRCGLHGGFNPRPRPRRGGGVEESCWPQGGERPETGKNKFLRRY